MNYNSDLIQTDITPYKKVFIDNKLFYTNECFPSHITEQPNDMRSFLLCCIWNGMTPNEVLSLGLLKIKSKTMLKLLCQKHNLDFNKARFIRALHKILSSSSSTEYNELVEQIRIHMESAKEDVSRLNIPLLQQYMRKIYKIRCISKKTE